ncbi:tetratricopeptide repeat protein [Nonomuraea sp. NPDC050540]|uniref:tetratricopeptide repeat protein n=1 Tax=Nonomuraea sp. NPDC050540 TaxID=3364367 RepID=UPI0037998BC1
MTGGYARHSLSPADLAGLGAGEVSPALADTLKRAIASRNIALRCGSGDADVLLAALRGTWYQLGQDQMIEVVRRAGDGFAEPGPAARVPEDAGVFTSAAEAAFGEGDFTGARRLASVAASRYQLEGDTRRQAQAMALHGEIALVEGDLTAARESFRSALNGFESLADRLSTARSLSALANVVATSGDHRAAADLYRQAVEINRTDVEARTGRGQVASNCAFTRARSTTSTVRSRSA